MTRILVIIAIALTIVAGIVAFGGASGLTDDGWMQLIWLALIATTTGSWMLASQKNLPTALRNMAIWVLIGAGLMVVWLVSQDSNSWMGRMLAALKPGSVTMITNSEGASEILLYKSADGHYHADVSINGVTIPMLVDTGATGIALTWEDAAKLGFKPDTLPFDRTVMTANGKAKSAVVTLNDVSIGTIHRSNLEAGVAEQGRLGRSLLGMNFLETLSAVTMSGQELRLRD